MFFHHFIQGCVSRSGNVDVLRWNKKKFSFVMYSLTLVPRDGDYWNLPKWTRNDFWLPHRPVLSHHEEELEKRVRLILLENFLFLSSFRMMMVSDAGQSRIKVDGLRRRSPPKIFTVPSSTGNISHLSWTSTLLEHWAFWHGFQMRPSSPILQCLRLVCLLSRFTRVDCISNEHTWQDFWTKLMISR